MSDIEKYADRSMFPAAPMQSVTPKVHLLWMTEDPLGAIAAACRMYKGIPTYNMDQITDEERKDFWGQIQETHLKAPLEFVKLHFFIEGVTRSFTHQLVRQRTAVYAQESLRFAVKENLAEEVAKPPSLTDPEFAHVKKLDLNKLWDDTVKTVADAYKVLVANGVPAEDARGLVPHATTTRVNYCTDLRNLLDHAGNRLCTQAQFEWREVFMGIVSAIGHYGMNSMHEWQFAHLAESGVFAPVCYEQNKCPFKADFDRGCTIRERVELNAAHGIPSSWWSEDHFTSDGKVLIEGIKVEEWLEDPKAAWQ